MSREVDEQMERITGELVQLTRSRGLAWRTARRGRWIEADLGAGTVARIESSRGRRGDAPSWLFTLTLPDGRSHTINSGDSALRLLYRTHHNVEDLRRAIADTHRELTIYCVP